MIHACGARCSDRGVLGPQEPRRRMKNQETRGLYDTYVPTHNNNKKEDAAKKKKYGGELNAIPTLVTSQPVDNIMRELLQGVIALLFARAPSSFMLVEQDVVIEGS